MNTIDITSIVNAAIALIGAGVSVFLIPWLMKKLLELLEQALKCEQVATITITIKPNQKPKQ